MEKRKIYRLLLLTVIIYSTIFSNVTIQQTVYASEKDVLNYEDNPYGKNYMSGRTQGPSGNFFNQTNAELEKKYQSLFGNESREEEQKRVEETGISSQPVLGEYRPDDHIADSIAADDQAKQKELTPPPNLSDEDIENALQECINAGYSKDHCAKVAPKYAECLATEADPLFCGMYLKVETQQKEGETNGTDGLVGAWDKYSKIWTDSEGFFDTAGNLIKEGASDLWAWAKENPVEAVLTVGTFFFPFGLVGNLAVRGILMGAGAISKANKFSKLVKVMNGSGNIVGRGFNKASAWAMDTFGGKTVTKLATGINNVSSATVRQWHRMGDFIKGRNPMAEYAHRNSTSAERFKALERYLANKEKNGIPLSTQDQMLAKARDAVHTLERQAKIAPKRQAKIASERAKKETAERVSKTGNTRVSYRSNDVAYSSTRPERSIFHKERDAITVRKINNSQIRRSGEEAYQKTSREVSSKINQKADQIRDAAGEAFKVSQEASVKANYLRRGSMVGAVGYDVYQFNEHSNNPKFHQTETEKRFKEVKTMTEGDRKALNVMHEKETQRTNYYKQEMDKMVKQAFAENGCSEQDVREIKWKTIQEADQQRQALEAKQAEVIKELQKTDEFKDLQTQFKESDAYRARIEQLQNQYDSGKTEYHPTEGDRSKLGYDIKQGRDLIQDANNHNLIPGK